MWARHVALPTRTLAATPASSAPPPKALAAVQPGHTTGPTSPGAIRDRRRGAVLRTPGAYRCCSGCGAARAPPPGAAGKGTDFDSGPSVPGPTRARRRGAAYHGKALLVPATTITTRRPANAALYALAPPRTGKRCSRWSRNAATSGGSRFSICSSEGDTWVRSAVKTISSRRLSGRRRWCGCWRLAVGPGGR